MATTIVVGSPNWISKAKSLIEKKRRFSLVVKGIEANAAWEALKNATSRGWAKRKLGGPTPREPASVVITVAICVTVIAVVGLGVVATVCIYGIHAGYDVKVKHRVTGPMPWDHSLTIVLIPPTR